MKQPPALLKGEKKKGGRWSLPGSSEVRQMARKFSLVVARQLIDFRIWEG